MSMMKMLVFIFGVLIAILGAAVWGASQVWLSGEDVEIGFHGGFALILGALGSCLLYTSPSPRDATLSRMPSSA